MATDTPHVSKENRKKITTLVLREMKKRGQPIAMLTAYDYPTAHILDQVGIDTILVGDSLGMVVLGYENTLPVTLDDMIHHCSAVSRGASYALLVGDMPYMTYNISVDESVRNAGRFLQVGGMDAVKLEGGRERSAVVKAIIDAGIPVMGHIGLTPQSIHRLGGFRQQGKTSIEAKRLIEDAHILEDAGCFSLVLESIPGRLAGHISQELSIPTIGIGAGAGCDGQVLVTHDLLGMFDRFTPRFVKRYADVLGIMEQAFQDYITDVQAGAFPGDEHTFEMDGGEWEEFLHGKI